MKHNATRLNRQSVGDLVDMRHWSETGKSPIERSRESFFDWSHANILDQYGTEVPDLASSPPKKTVLVVPSLAEFSNDNFWRLLRSLALQQGVDQADFATLIVVNNSSRSVDLPGGDLSQNKSESLGLVARFEGRDSDLLTARYQENQMHLGVLRLFTETKTLLENTNPGDREKIVEYSLQNLQNSVPAISKHELSVFRLALIRGVNIFGVDASSRGKALVIEDSKRNPIGLARNIGGHIAYELLNRFGVPDSLIDFLDGDAFPSNNYFKEMSELGALARGGYVVKPMLPQVVDIPRSIAEIEDKYRKIASLIQYLVSSVHRRRGRYWPLFPSRVLGGPQIAVSPALFRSVGGYPINGDNEDYVFADSLKEYGRCIPMKKEVVYLSDRDRIGSTDWIDSGKAIRVGRQMETIVDARKTADQETRQTALSVIGLNQTLERRFGKAYETLRAELFEKESAGRRIFIKVATDTIRTICDEYSHIRNEGDKITILLTALREKISPRQYDFLCNNTALLSALTTTYDIVVSGKNTVDKLLPPENYLPTSYDHADVVISLLRQYLPEYFLAPPDEEPVYDLETVRRFPGTVNFRDYVHIYEASYRAYAGAAQEEEE